MKAVCLSCGKVEYSYSRGEEVDAFVPEDWLFEGAYLFCPDCWESPKKILDRKAHQALVRQERKEEVI